MTLPAVFAALRADEGLTAGALKDFLEHVPDHATIRDEASAVVLFLQADWEVSSR